MSNYTQVTDFSTKDNLVSGDAAKVIKGTDVDAEFSAIATAINSKISETETVIPAGTIMLFITKVVPTGWSLVNTWNQKSLLLNSSISSSNAFTTGGNWTIASGTLTSSGSLPNHTHNTGTLTTSTASDSGNANNYFSGTNGTTHGKIEHTHTVSGTTANPGSLPNISHTHTGNMVNGAWRPAYVEVISCSKDA
jgi:hypothetical protein